MDRVRILVTSALLALATAGHAQEVGPGAAPPAARPSETPAWSRWFVGLSIAGQSGGPMTDVEAAMRAGAFDQTAPRLTEGYETHPAIRDACRHGIEGHARTVATDIAEAKAKYAPDADWDSDDLALYTQAVLQGAFVLAKATQDPRTAVRCVEQLKRHVASLLGAATGGLPPAAPSSAAHSSAPVSSTAQPRKRRRPQPDDRSNTP